LSGLLARPAVLIFLLTWFAYGAAINSSNLIAFDLQQIGVEAMVERPSLLSGRFGVAANADQGRRI